jgi:NAD(P)-dependent dehydrogenase (short-subunit alcohol dehydrogenase family)
VTEASLNVTITYNVSANNIEETQMATSASGQARWTEADIPDQAGRVAVVTGANAGLGLQTAKLLARRGAQVVLACRNPARAEQAAAALRSAYPAATVALDLASLASVRTAAAKLRAAYPRLDLLINNAGVMEVPYERTEDGFELTLGTNHLGHFALTGLLLPSLLATPGSRVVTMSSQGHASGIMNFEDLHCDRGYEPATAYFQSKLANLLFTYELDRRLRAAAATTIAVAAHPGVVYTDLFRTRSKLDQLLISPRLRAVNFWFAQSIRMGALPVLRAATDPAVRGGDFYGPRRRFDTGYPARVESSARSRDVADQARLWAVSEQLTGVACAVAR